MQKFEVLFWDFQTLDSKRSIHSSPFRHGHCPDVKN